MDLSQSVDRIIFEHLGSFGKIQCSRDEWNPPEQCGLVFQVERPISHFEFGASGNELYVAVSENAGEGLRVLQLGGGR